jgi:CHAT domain-containing protein/tetratricopeptide (TPR) repeat protein
MRPTSVPDVHAPYVRELVTADDWAGLVRYWMAHACPAALDAALALVSRHVHREGGEWPVLENFLVQLRGNPAGRGPRSLERGFPAPTRAGQLTASLLDLYPRWFAGYFVAQVPAAARGEATRLCIEAGLRACRLAEALNDHALCAFIRSALGSAYLASGQLAAARENLEQVVALYRRLDEDRPGVYEPALAMTLRNLGDTQRGLNDLAAALRSYQEALRLFDTLVEQGPSQFDPSWVAMILFDLGTVQSELQRPQDARRSFLEALARYQELARENPAAHLQKMAMTLNNLGNVQRSLGDLATARLSLGEALNLFRGMQDWPAVARVLTSVGDLESEAQQLQAAHGSFAEAVTIYQRLESQQPGDHLYNLVAATNNLGTAQWGLTDLEATQHSFREATALCRRLADLEPGAGQDDQLATTLHHLGTVQWALNDLEAARNTLGEALDIRGRLAEQGYEPSRAGLADTCSSLGVLYRSLNELESARESYQAALALYRLLAEEQAALFEPLVAATLNDLGNVSRALGEVKAAAASHREALALFLALSRGRPGSFLSEVAMTCHNLGTAQRNLEELEAARGTLEKALAVRRQLAERWGKAWLTDVAITLNELAAVHLRLGMRFGAAKDPEAARKSYEAARAGFVEAVELHRQEAGTAPTRNLLERLSAWANLGRLYLQECPALRWPDLRQARDALREACRCAAGFRGRFHDLRRRQRVPGEAVRFSELLVETCVDLGLEAGDTGALREAVEVAEAGRARNLMEMLADEALQPAGAPPDRVEAFGRLRRRLRQQERLVQEAEAGPGPLAEVAGAAPATRQRGPALPALRPGRLRQELQRVQAEYEAALRRLQTDHDPEFDPDRPVRPISFTEVQELLPADIPTAVVQYSLTRERGLALLVTREQVEAVRLPDLNDRQASELAGAWHEAARHRDTWEDALPGLLEPVAGLAVRPVWQALAARGIRRLILSPYRALHLFPLHACRLDDGRHLADACEVVYTPGLSVLHRCAQRQRPRPRRLVLAENPTGDLPFAAAEAAALRRLYADCLPLGGHEITKERLLREAAGSHVLHYSGRAGFDPSDPLRSALVLEDKDESRRDRWLSLRDIFTRLHLPQNVLTVLNGCESGPVLPDRVDEYLGLPSGLLYAGATCVLSTLWAVADLSGALLSVRFHQEWLGGKTIAAALHAAQRWLRDDIRDGRYLQQVVLPEVLKLGEDAARQRCEEAAAELALKYPDRPPFASPVHWAPFIATGLAYEPPGRRAP